MPENSGMCLGGGWKGAKELGVSQLAVIEGAKALPGVLQAHGMLLFFLGRG